MSNKYDRIVVLVDMDCFYCQVEEKLNPELCGKPIAVVQKGGGIIAVNYAARNRGVTPYPAHARLVRVPNVRGKVDLSKYRDAGKEVASVLQTFTPLLERASVDEAYLDITQTVNERLEDMEMGTFTVTPEMLVNSYALGYDDIGQFFEMSVSLMNDVSLINGPNNNAKLLIAATVVTEIRRVVKEKTGYECSAGIAHNKILAKLVCGLNKPNKQTLLPITSVDHLYRTMSVKKIQGLGGMFGQTVCDSLKITNMVELANFPLEDLQRRFDDKNGLWLYNIARGIDLAPVTQKTTTKRICCSKNFPGRTAIKNIATLQHWLSELSVEMLDRIGGDAEENHRTPRQITVSFMQRIDGSAVNCSRSVPLTLVDAPQMAVDALDVIKRNTVTFFKADQTSVLNNPIVYVGIAVGKFEDLAKGEGGGNTILEMFSKKSKQNEQVPSAKSNSHTSTYAELQTVHSIEHPATTPISTKLCPKCSQPVPHHELQSHTDAHFAFQLSQDQRLEFRQNQVKSVGRNQPAAKKPKPSGAPLAKSKSASLSLLYKFLTKTVVSPTECDTLIGVRDVQPLQKCTECERMMRPDRMQEHSDYHAARRLQMEWNGPVFKRAN